MTKFIDTINYDLDYVRNDMFEYGDYEEYEKAEDIPDELVYDTLRMYYEDDLAQLDDVLREHYHDKFIVCGSLGLWYGRVDVLKRVTARDIINMFGDYDDVVAKEDSNGDLLLELYHHDGVNCLSVRVLTDKGIKYLDKHKDFDKKVFFDNKEYCIAPKVSRYY